MSKVVLYSDFDGVYHIPKGLQTVMVNTDPASRYLRAQSRVSWNPKTVSSMRSVVEDHELDHRWLTTWNEESNILRAVEHLGFGDGFEDHILPNFDHGAESNRDWTRWKAIAILEDQAANPRPFVWIDDKAPSHWADFVRGYVETPSLILQPNSSIGLTEDHFSQIRSFLEGIG